MGASTNTTNSDAYRKRMRVNCGVFYNRGRFVSTIIMIPIIVIFACSRDILVAIGQDAQVSAIAHVYVCIMIPGVWSMGQFDATKKFLSSQYSAMIPVVVQLVTTCLHFTWCKLFI
jgi:Na+-driven multidrug efflux pump